MRRREFLKTLASISLAGMSGNVFGQEVPSEYSQGWVPNPLGRYWAMVIR